MTLHCVDIIRLSWLLHSKRQRSLGKGDVWVGPAPFRSFWWLNWSQVADILDVHIRVPANLDWVQGVFAFHVNPNSSCISSLSRWYFIRGSTLLRSKGGGLVNLNPIFTLLHLHSTYFKCTADFWFVLHFEKSILDASDHMKAHQVTSSKPGKSGRRRRS